MCVPLGSLFCVLSHEVWWALKSPAIIRLGVLVRVERSGKKSGAGARYWWDVYVYYVEFLVFYLNFYELHYGVFVSY